MQRNTCPVCRYELKPQKRNEERVNMTPPANEPRRGQEEPPEDGQSDTDHLYI